MRLHPVMAVLCIDTALLPVVTLVWVATLKNNPGNVPRFEAGFEWEDRPVRVDGEAMTSFSSGSTTATAGTSTSNLQDDNRRGRLL